MGLLLEARRNLNDVRHFGPRFLLRHFKRLSGGNLTRVTIPDVGSVFIRPAQSDLSAFRQVFAYREYDLGEFVPAAGRVQDRYRSILASGRTPVVIDAGANVGAASLWFGSQFPDAAIVAIEPEPGNLEVLRLNAEGKPQVSVLAAAIGSQPGFVEVDSNGLGWAAQTRRSDKGTAVVTVNDAVKTVADGELFIVKVDIEGFERDLFSTNIDWLDDAFMVIIEPHDWMLPGQRSSGPFQKAMGSRDFELFISGENLIYVRL